MNLVTVGVFIPETEVDSTNQCSPSYHAPPSLLGLCVHLLLAHQWGTGRRWERYYSSLGSFKMGTYILIYLGNLTYTHIHEYPIPGFHSRPYWVRAVIYSFPIAAITNYHKLNDLKTTKSFSFTFMKSKIKVSVRLHSLCRSQETICFHAFSSFYRPPLFLGSWPLLVAV